uniref:ASPSCR1 tether for SLC2A4, UBX domain containing n=1 Tax=Dicentrarchus labrax TaxID=13489 RepID=A0A8P4GL51_DICLA
MAASGTAVTVLTPNGRRQTVKVSPNTPLLQVLEDVCKKHGFNPEDHGLKFQRTTIDLTRPWRFANLPNNAKLEMVTSTRKQAVADSQVRIALQMEDGSRLQGSFSCGQSLWELLTHFPQIRCVYECVHMYKMCVCVCVSGEEALKKATLKSLGLTGGSAIVRLVSCEDGGEVTETAAVPTVPVAKETTPSPPSQPDPAPSRLETPTTEVPIKKSSPDRPMETPPAPPPASAASTLPVQQEKVPNSQDAVRPKSSPVERGPPEEDGEKPGPSGLNSHPSSSSSSSATPSVPFIPFSGGGQRLGGPGGGAVLRSLSSSSSSSALSALTAAVESPKAKKAKSSHGSATKRQNPANQPDEDMDEGEEFLEPVEREPLIYHLELMSRHSEDHGNLPDEFFEVTVDDVRKRFAQLKSERKLLEEAPLMTKSLRETQMKEKLEKYPKVVLRVQFPDRHVLQGFFRPLETGLLFVFVENLLSVITPPKTILDDPSATLFQVSSLTLLYFSRNKKSTSCFRQSIFFLLSHLSSMLLSPSVPTGSEEPLSPPEPSPDTSESTEDEEDPSAHTKAAKPTRSDLGKVPKWLKLPGEDGTGCRAHART